MIIENKLSLIKLYDGKFIKFAIFSLQMEVQVAKMLIQGRIATLLYYAWVIDIHTNGDRV